jgi:hypothetical protein
LVPRKALASGEHPAVSEAEAAVDPRRFLLITAVGVEKLSIISRERKPREDEKRL